jgi:hypothetical protein
VLRERVYGRFLVAHPEDVPVEMLELDVANSELPGVDLSAYSLLRAPARRCAAYASTCW